MILTLIKNRTHKSKPNGQLFSVFFYPVNDYVFGGQFAGARYSEESLQNLRKAFATQMFEASTDIRNIHELLGHSAIKATMIYTLVTNKAI